jgi:hypothetical protein
MNLRSTGRIKMLQAVFASGGFSFDGGLRAIRQRDIGIVRPSLAEFDQAARPHRDGGGNLNAEFEGTVRQMLAENTSPLFPNWFA